MVPFRRPEQIVLRSLCVILAALALSGQRAAAGEPADALWVDAASAAPAPDGSRAKPFAKIGDALKRVAPGGTVVVKEGVYRERVSVPGGKPGRPTTLAAAPGARVVICGLRAITGWQPAGKGVFTVKLNWRPSRLFVGYRPQPLAREPNEGWWAAAQAQDDTLVDAEHLRQPLGDLAGAAAYVWTQTGNTFFALPVAGQNPAAGSLRLKLTNKWAKLKNGDKYYLQNHPSFIDQPGEWAVQKQGEQFQVFLRPANEADLDATQAQWKSGNGVSVRNAQHVRLSGLEVVGWEKYGVEVMKSQDVEVARCRVAMNGHTGILVRSCQNGTVSNNLVSNNGVLGVCILYSDGVQIRNNEIAFNRVDWLIIAWKTRNVAVERNYIHHHLWWGHPDNAQMYRDVEGVRFVDNLLLAGGQGVMMEQCRQLEFRGNMMVGTLANMLIFGHGNAGDAVVAHNTFAFPGYSCLSLTASGYKLFDNVFMMGHGKTFYSIRGVKDFEADRNLYWAGPRATASIVSDRGWHRTYAEYRKANPDLDVHSKYGDPGLVNAPLAFAVLDSKRLAQCTRSRLYLRGGTKGFNAGEYVEINFDGRVRRITACERGAITIDPPLPARPIKPWLVANWAANDDFALDLRLKSAVGRKADAPGSNISIPDFRRGDFDGDGKRDTPAYPDDWGRDARTSPTAVR